MNNKFKWLAGLGMLSLFSLPVAADEILPPAQADAPLILGAGVIYRDKTYRAYDDGEKAQVIPLIMWENESFFFRGATFGWKAWSNESWEFAVIGEGRGDGYDSDDANILTGMDDRDMTLDGGAYLAWKNGAWGVKATAVHDLAGKHEGYEARVEASYTHVSESRNWMIRPSAGIVYQSDDLVDYYYGVQSDEAVPGFRAAFSADAETIFRFQTVVAWNPGGSKWQLILGGRFDAQGDEFDDSPITDDDKLLMGFFAAGYRF